jgi:RHS repeat-associated protein
LGDNLGNTRVTFGTKTGAAVLYQQDDYYPFGLEINRSVLSPKNEYLYNRKELQEETGLYDYGNRYLDPLLGRWDVVDKKAEDPTQISLSPYAYVGNNPINKTDPDGNCPSCIIEAALAIAGTEEGATLGVATPAAIVTVAIGGIAAIGDFFIQSHHDNYHVQSTSEKPRGSNNEKVKDAAKTGQEAHRQEQKKLAEKGAATEQTLRLPKTGDKVRKDAVLPDGTAVIIKPDSKTGKKSAEKREKLLEKNDIPTQTIFYDPLNPAYQPNSPSYIGPKKSN